MSSSSQFYGGSSGTPYDMDCPSGAFVTSIAGRQGDSVLQLEMGCSDGSLKSVGNSTGGSAVPELRCASGMKQFKLQYGSKINQAQFSCGSQYLTMGKPSGSYAEFTCPGDQVLTGFSTRYSTSSGILGLQYHCSNLSKCSSAQTILSGTCEDYCANPDTARSCVSQVTNYCKDRMRSDTACRSYVMAHPGKYDDLMRDYCATALDDYMCSCYIPVSVEGASSSAQDLINSNPQCWNQSCVALGYKNQNLIDLAGKCPNVQLQECIVNNTVNVGGTVQGDVSISTSTQCQQFTDKGKSNSDWVIPVLFVVFLVVGVSAVAIATRKKKKKK